MKKIDPLQTYANRLKGMLIEDPEPEELAEKKKNNIVTEKEIGISGVKSKHQSKFYIPSTPLRTRSTRKKTVPPLISEALPYSVIQFIDGVYCGESQNADSSSVPDGYGSFLSNDGNFYSGTWKDGAPSGFGYYYFFTGGVFFGEIEDGQANGHGVYSSSENDFIYRGDFQNGAMQGSGTVFHGGSFFSTKMHANKIVYAEKTSISSFMFDPRIHRINNSEEELDFVYRWIHPAFRPQLIQLSSRTPISERLWKKLYRGGKEGERRHGVGTLLRYDGSRFHGCFINGEPNGLGLTTDNKGNFEIGVFIDGQPEEFSINCSSFGDRYIGCIFKAEYEGPGIYYRSGGKTWQFCDFDSGSIKTLYLQREGSLLKDQVRLDQNLLTTLLSKTFGDKLQKKDKSSYHKIMIGGEQSYGSNKEEEKFLEKLRKAVQKAISQWIGTSPNQPPGHSFNGLIPLIPEPDKSYVSESEALGDYRYKDPLEHSPSFSSPYSSSPSPANQARVISHAQGQEMEDTDSECDLSMDEPQDFALIN